MLGPVESGGMGFEERNSQDMFRCVFGRGWSAASGSIGKSGVGGALAQCEGAAMAVAVVVQKNSILFFVEFEWIWVQRQVFGVGSSRAQMHFLLWRNVVVC